MHAVSKLSIWNQGREGLHGSTYISHTRRWRNLDSNLLDFVGVHYQTVLGYRRSNRPHLTVEFFYDGYIPRLTDSHPSNHPY